MIINNYDKRLKGAEFMFKNLRANFAELQSGSCNLYSEFSNYFNFNSPPTEFIAIIKTNKVGKNAYLSNRSNKINLI